MTGPEPAHPEQGDRGGNETFPGSFGVKDRPVRSAVRSSLFG